MDNTSSTVWSTDDLPPSEQFAYWREMICKSFVSLTPAHRNAREAIDTTQSGFLGSVEQRPLGAMTRSHIRAHAQQTRRTQRDVARDDGEFYFLNLQLSGDCRVEHGGQQTLLTPGRYVILDTRLPYVLDFPAEWSMYSYRIPASWLDPFRPATTSPNTPSGDGAVHELLAGTVKGLWEVNGDSAQGALAQSLSSLIAATWSTPAPTSSGALLRQRAIEHMASTLADPDTTVTSIAARLHVSVRALHTAFEEADMTAAETLRHLRMDRAHILLNEGRLSVAEVGLAVGYPQPSSFSRAFKTTLGHAPASASPRLLGRPPAENRDTRNRAQNVESPARKVM